MYVQEHRLWGLMDKPHSAPCLMSLSLSFLICKKGRNAIRVQQSTDERMDAMLLRQCPTQGTRKNHESNSSLHHVPNWIFHSTIIPPNKGSKRCLRKVDWLLPRAGGVGGKRGVTADGDRVSFWDDENVLKLVMLMVAHIYEYTKNHRIVHFRHVNCVACELNLKSLF
uniref:Uncharacterized protein n=1 Tax=Gorilla gorilla gorilla TaxID=9595 RepID=G3RXB6_GORGO